MNKAERTNNTEAQWFHALLVVSLVLLILPLFLEFLVLAPLMWLHLITGDAYWLLAQIIVGSAVVAGLVGLVAVSLIIFCRSRITQPKTKSLSRWVLGLFACYLVLVALLFVLYLNLWMTHS